MSALASLRKYGPTGIGTYLTISFGTWLGVFVAIENNLDVDSILQYWLGEDHDAASVLKEWGLKPADPAAKSWASTVPSAVLALMASKALVPIKIPVAMALTPYVRRLLVSRGVVPSMKA